MEAGGGGIRGRMSGVVRMEEWRMEGLYRKYQISS